MRLVYRLISELFNALPLRTRSKRTAGPYALTWSRNRVMSVRDRVGNVCGWKNYPINPSEKYNKRTTGVGPATSRSPGVIFSGELPQLVHRMLPWVTPAPISTYCSHWNEDIDGSLWTFKWENAHAFFLVEIRGTETRKIKPLFQIRAY